MVRLLQKQSDNSVPCVVDHVACDGVPPRVCSRCQGSSFQCRYKHLELERRRSTSPSLPSSSSGLNVHAEQPAPTLVLDGLVALGNAAETIDRYDASTMWTSPVDGVDDSFQWLTDLISSATNTAMPGNDIGSFDLNFPLPAAADPVDDEDELRILVLPAEVDGRPNHPQPIPDGRVESVGYIVCYPDGRLDKHPSDVLHSPQFRSTWTLTHL